MDITGRTIARAAKDELTIKAIETKAATREATAQSQLI
ncbi:hypothetical protein ACPOL_4413 [Acidisarcina polymorpha]|uniref:Uncharacterized protein n=1 Tax=Acidisarcina polymorpha TaxID=2211140 RepID=A0A2Z5G568_9BACT|nr:hypothetical protein ACPOL_4413 [Acidisarcina polymorpha]